MGILIDSLSFTTSLSPTIKKNADIYIVQDRKQIVHVDTPCKDIYNAEHYQDIH